MNQQLRALTIAAFLSLDLAGCGGGQVTFCVAAGKPGSCAASVQLSVLSTDTPPSTEAQLGAVVGDYLQALRDREGTALLRLTSPAGRARVVAEGDTAVRAAAVVLDRRLPRAAAPQIHLRPLEAGSYEARVIDAEAEGDAALLPALLLTPASEGYAVELTTATAAKAQPRLTTTCPAVKTIS